MPKDKQRIVITGLGVVSSIGIGWKDFWKNLLNGTSGISKITHFRIEGVNRFNGGEVRGFDPSEFLPAAKVKNMGRASQFTIIASKLALKDAKLSMSDFRNKGAGACVGTTMGELQILEQLDNSHVEKGFKGIAPHKSLTYPAHIISSHLAQELRFRGVNYLFGNACAAGNYSIAYALEMLRTRQANLMLAGGVDAMTRLNLTGFNRLLAVAPEKCQPFDKNRKGMLVGEGCGMLVMETLENALKRKAPLYAEVLGYGLSCDARHMTSPTEEGIALEMKKAIAHAGINPEDVDYVSAHGTGTKENDKAECSAIKQVFGKRYKQVPVSSIKSMLGHTMGAASALEAIACCLAIHDSKIPPTINFETPDPECDIDCVPNKSRSLKVQVALNNSSAFGGNNAGVVLRKVKD